MYVNTHNLGHVAALVRFAPIRLIPSAENNENKTKNEADNNIYCFGYPIKIIFTSSCYTTPQSMVGQYSILVWFIISL